MNQSETPKSNGTQELRKVLIKHPGAPGPKNSTNITGPEYSLESERPTGLKKVLNKNPGPSAFSQTNPESTSKMWGIPEPGKSKELIKVLIKHPGVRGQTNPPITTEPEDSLNPENTKGMMKQSTELLLEAAEPYGKGQINTLNNEWTGGFADPRQYSQVSSGIYSKELEAKSVSSRPYVDQSTPAAMVRAFNAKVISKAGGVSSGEHNLASPSEKPKKPNAFLIAEQLLARYQFALYKESIYVFCGNYYRLFEQAEMCRLIKANFMSEACASGTNGFLMEVCNFIYHDARIIRQEEDFGELQNLIAFRNGVLNVQTGVFSQPDPKYFFLHYINVDYNPGPSGACPHFRSFLQTIANGDEQVTRRIWEMMGYIFSNDVYGRAFFLLQGKRRSGKSTLGEFICSFFPEEARTALSLDEFANNFSLGNLHGKAICVDLDLPDGKFSYKDIGRLKKITGNDTITADVKFKPRVKFKSRAKLLFATNNPFELTRDDPAVWDRLQVIPFNVSIPRERSNYHLLESFEPERLVIVKEAIAYYRQLALNNYKFSGNFQVNANIPSYQKKENYDEAVKVVPPKELVEKFVTNCCQFVSDGSYSFTTDLFNAFNAFYANEPMRLISIKAFSRILNEEYSEFARKDRGRRTSQADPESCYYGIILKESLVF